MLKMGIITGFLSQTKDRFHEYNKPLDLDQKFALMTEIEGCDGVEIVYPYEVNDPVETREILAKHNLNIAAINVNVKAEPEFRNGGLTSHDKGVRAKAVRFIKEAKDFAAGVGADKVTCCPLGDGYEFAFQYDYARNTAVY
jgi:xylose isomerase